MSERARKVMLLGQIGVGKSSIAQRLVFDRFEATYKPTIGVDVYRYEANAGDIGQPSVPLILWDSDGNLGDAIFRHVYLKEASAAIIVSDATRPETVTAMMGIGEEFRARMPGRCVTLIINKTDLVGVETPALPDDMEKKGSLLFHTSARTGKNVALAFQETVQAMLRQSR